MKITSGKKKKLTKGNYGEVVASHEKDCVLKSMIDHRMSNAMPSEASYVNVKNTIASNSSKKTSNNTSCLVSTSSRNASITPRKIVTKIKIQGSPDTGHNLQINDRTSGVYKPNSKIHQSKIRAKVVKLPNKHKVINNKSIRASSGSNRMKFHPLKLSKEDLKSQGISRDEMSSKESMPTVTKNRPTTGIYGAMKQKSKKGKKYSSLTKYKNQLPSNAHPHNGGVKRSINADDNTKFVDRTCPDQMQSQFEHFQSKVMRSSEKVTQNNSALRCHKDLKNTHTGWFSSQENVACKFMSRNDPYQNANTNKTIIRTVSEKRVNFSEFQPKSLKCQNKDVQNTSIFSKTFEKDL